MNMQFSDYIVYVDESGDHGLQSIDPNYPVFVLALCIFHKRYYSETVVPTLQKFKFKHFGHDVVVLHEHEIRKEKGAFNLFTSKQQKYDFLNEMTEIIDSSHFILTCCVIDKKALLKAHSEPDNPYHIALALGLERIYQFLEEKGQHELLKHIVFEERGKKEDAELELRRICDGQNYYKQTLPFDIKLANKQTNSAGLQLADLVARPVGLSVLRPEQANRAFDVLKKKFLCDGGRDACGTDYEGLGLKRFP